MKLGINAVVVVLWLFSAHAVAAHPVDDLAHLTVPAKKAVEKAAALGHRLADCPVLPGKKRELDKSMVGQPVTHSKWMGCSTWAWSFYPLPDTDETCIVLLEPILDPLSKSRAAILLMLVAHITPDGSPDDFPALPLGGSAAVAEIPPSPPIETAPTRWKDGEHPVDKLAHLTAPANKARSLGYRLRECPLMPGSSTKIDTGKAKLQATLMRGVGDTLWVWNTYRVSRNKAVCVELVKPFREPLSRTRAAILTMATHNVLPNGSMNNDEVPPWPHTLPSGEEQGIMALAEPHHEIDELAYETPPARKAEALGFRLSACPMRQTSPAQVDLSKLGPPITVAKRIREWMWEWQEFPVLGSDTVCVLLLSPQREPLSKEHAAILTMYANGIPPSGTIKDGVRYPGQGVSSGNATAR